MYMCGQQIYFFIFFEEGGLFESFLVVHLFAVYLL